MRLNLEYGGGWISAFLNLEVMEVEEYNSDSATRIHSDYGGEQYYCSRSGASGAGWIAGMQFRPVTVYRVDTRYAQMGEIEEALPGLTIFYPFNYGGWECREPMVVKYGQWPEGEVYCFQSRGTRVNLQRPDDEREFIYCYYRPRYGNWEELVDGEVTIHKKAFKVTGEADDRVMFRFFEALEIPQTRRPRANEFWAYLGLYPVGNWVWKMTNYIIRSATPVDEIEDKLPELVPQNVQVIRPDFYIQERERLGGGSVFVAVARANHEGEEYAFEKALENTELVDILSGDYRAIYEELLEGCRIKFERIREAEKSEKHRRLFEKHFGQLVEEHGDLTISIQDSIDAGNCPVGTKAFRDKHFPGKDAVTLRELAIHKENPGVWRVLKWVLRDVSFGDGEV